MKARKTDRGRLPAYGRDLLQQRRAGNHPSRVTVIVGDDWARLPAGEPAVCVDEDWRPGTTDWTPLAGCPIRLVCRWPYSSDDDEHPLGFLPLLTMAGEIALRSAPVTLYYLDDFPRAWSAIGEDAAEQARDACMRLSFPTPPAMPRGADYRRWLQAKATTWPAPWSWALYDDYQRRYGRWIDVAAAVAA